MPTFDSNTVSFDSTQVSFDNGIAGAAISFDNALIGFDSSDYTFDGGSSLAQVLDVATGIFTLTGEAATFSSGNTIVCATGIFALVGEAATLSSGLANGVMLCQAGIFNLTGADAQADFELDVATGIFTLTGEPAEVSASPPVMFCAPGLFSLTGSAANFAQSGPGTLLCSAGVFTVTGFAAAVTANTPMTVQAVTAGEYNGEQYLPGDVFVIDGPEDFSDSTQNAEPSGNEYAPGWMKSVASSTPTAQVLSTESAPTYPAVDPARRFVL